MKTTLFLILMTLSNSLLAARAAQSRGEFCRNRSDSDYVKNLTRNYQNLMPMRNGGGVAGTGVCWWHSRFQRKALYLTIYKPEERLPTQEEAKIIIQKIRAGDDLVEIPGMSNFNDFSWNFKDLIQDELNRWQKADGVKGAWIAGLKGNNKVSASKMQDLMEDLYTEVELNNNIAYQKLQVRGVTAHSWLVIKMKNISNGYELHVIDSNYPETVEKYIYERGMTHFMHPEFGAFTPYLENVDEMRSIRKTIRGICL